MSKPFRFWCITRAIRAKKVKMKRMKICPSVTRYLQAGGKGTRVRELLDKAGKRKQADGEGDDIQHWKKMPLRQEVSQVGFPAHSLFLTFVSCLAVGNLNQGRLQTIVVITIEMI